MNTIATLAFRKSAESILRRIAKAEWLVLSYRGKPAAGLGPVSAAPSANSLDDPFLGTGRRATSSRKGKTGHAQIDRILYGRG